MPRRAYILVNENDAVICRVSTHNGSPNLSTFAEAERVRDDLRRRYNHQYTIYAIVPVTARVMLEPLETTPELTQQPDRGSSLSTADMERMTGIMRSTAGASSRSRPTGRPTPAPRPEPAPEDLERARLEGQDRPDRVDGEPEDLPF